MSNGTLFDYDLNIFQEEMEVGYDEYNCRPIFDYAGPWYIHIYECIPGMHIEYANPIKLTRAESNDLIKNDPYFDGEPDTWYGLQGFLEAKADLLSLRLKDIFDSLPKYKEEVLF